MMVFVLVVSFLFDGILTNFLPSFQGDLSLFTPYLSVVALFLIFPLYHKNDVKKYYLTVAIYGFLYDVFYTNILMSHVLFFLILAFLSQKIWKNIEVNYFTLPLIFTVLIGIYHLLLMGILVIFNVIKPNFNQYLYLFSHSLLLNLIVGEIFYFILYKTKKKIKING